MSNVWGLWVFLWLSTRLMCQSLEFFETNLFHTNKNVEWILKSVAKQSTLLQVSVYEYYIPIIAGCILPLYFACLWAKLMRVNRPHCSQVGNEAGTSLGPAGSKVGMVYTSPHFSSPWPDVPTVLSLACWLPCDTCQHHGLVIFAWIGAHQPWQPFQQGREYDGAQRKDGLREAHRYYNQFLLIILVICDFQVCKAISIFRY